MASLYLNPYVGPQPFNQNQAQWFFGRDREIRELASLIVAHREVVLHSQSGAGKTSLLNAGVFQRLESRGFTILPLARVIGPSPRYQSDLDDIPNLFTYNVLSGWSPDDLIQNELSTLTLTSYLQRHTSEKFRSSRLRIVIFDQFEELFTSYPHRWQDRAVFLEQIAAALNVDKHLRVVFAIRDEYVALLRGFGYIFPEGLRVWFHLERLRKEAACEAVSKPAEMTPGRSYDPDAVKTLVERLLTVPVRIGEATEKIEGEFVEPVQLQIVCSSLWRNLPADTHRIESRHIETLSRVDEALMQYYMDSVSQTSKRFGVRKPKIRRWFEKELITEAGTRGIVYRGDKFTGGLSNPVVDELQNRYLVRAVPRAGADWYELTHDRFIEPIRLASQRAQERLRPLKLAAVAFAVLMVLIPLGLMLQAQYKSTQLLKLEQDPEKLLRHALREAIINYHRWQEDRFSQEAAEIQDSLQFAVNLLRPTIGEAFTHKTFPSNARILAAEFSSDGGSLATWENRQQDEAAKSRLWIWDAASGELKYEFSPEKTLEIQTIAVSAEGGCVAVLDQAGVLWFRNKDGDKDLKPLNATARPGLVSAIFNSGGTLLAAGAWDGIARIWDSPPKNIAQKIVGHRGVVWDVAFNPEGNLLASAGADRLIKLWDVETGDERETLKGHTKDVRRVAFSPNGTLLASAGWDHRVIVWKVESKDALHTLIGHSRPVNGIAFDHSGSKLASGASDGAVKIWDLTSGKILKSLEGHRRSVRDVCFSPTGELLASASADKTAKIWDVSTGKDILTLTGHRETVWSVAFNHDGGLIVTASKDGAAKIWDAKTGELKMTLPGYSGIAVNQAVFSPAGDTVVTVADDAMCRWYNVQTGAKQLQIGAGDFSYIALNPEGNRLAAIMQARDLALLDTGSPAGQTEILGPQVAASHVLFSPAGGLLAVADTKGSIAISDVVSRKSISILTGSGQAYQTIAFSHDSKRMAAVDQSGNTMVWTISSNKKSVMKGAREMAVRAITLNSSGKIVATAGEDNRIRAWNVDTGNLILSMTVPTNNLYRLSFTPNGGYLTAVGGDGAFRRYNTADFYSQDIKPLMAMAFDRLPGELNQAAALALRGKSQGAISLLQKVPPDSASRIKADHLIKHLETGTFAPSIFLELLEEGNIGISKG